MKKKLLLFLLFTYSCIATHAADTYCTVDGIRYSIGYGGASVYECHKGGDIVIPESITYQGEDYLVTEIYGGAFASCTRLHNITIPESVTRIGGGAFSGCSGLTHITIPDGVTSIEESTFYGCTSLTSITIPDSITSIGNYAFEDCTSLRNVTLPRNLTSVVWCMFRGCSSLESITIPDSVTAIDSWAFERCSSLQSITLPDGIMSIGQSAFYDCSSLQNLTIPESVTSIGKEAFYNCSSMQNLIIPQSVSSIGDYAFRNCTGTLYLNCPLNGNRYTFDNSVFERIVLGDAVQSLPYRVFDYITALKEVVLPNTLTDIGQEAFDGCSGLTSITIPESVTSIGSHAFSRCTALQSINIPKNVMSIGNNAFEYCTGTLRIDCNIASAISGSFERVILSPSVSYIGESALNSLTQACFIVEAETPPTLATNALPQATIFIYVPEGTVEAYESAWGQPTSSSYTYCYLEQGATLSGTCGDNLTWELDPLSGHLAIHGYGDMTETPWQKYNTKISSLSLPDGLTSICAYAFQSCQLTEIDIPQSVTTIGAWAFYGCPLTELVVPEGVTTIEQGAFNIWTFERITLPSTLASIGERAFVGYGGSSKLQEVHIAATTPPTLGTNAFTFQNNINLVYIPQNTTAAYQAAWGTDYHYIEPDGSAEITGIIGGQLSWTFNPLSGKLSIQGTGAIPDYTYSITSGGQPWLVYRDYITSIELSEGITAIGNYAFSNLSNISELTIPSSVTKIGYNILEGSGATALHYQATAATVGYYFNSGVINSSMGGWMIGTPSENAMFTGSQVKDITFSDNVTEIPAFFFANDTALHSITIPNTVTKIGGGAFYRCSNLRSITLPENLTIIDTCAFQGTGIDSLVIPAGVTRICQNAFRNSELHYIEIPESVTEIETGAFAGCNMGALRLPENLTALPARLFYVSNSGYYGSVRSLNIGKNIQELNEYIFDRCTIDSIIYNARNVGPVTKNSSANYILPSSVVSITFGDSVEIIPDYLCENLQKLNKVIIPNSVKEIGAYAFSQCYGLEEVVMGDSVAFIDEYAFNQCYALSDISLPDTLSAIYSNTFANCWSLRSVTLPAQLRYIYEKAFYRCTALQSIRIPDGVYYMGDRVFYECSGLDSVVIPASLYNMGEYAFYGCMSLQSLTFNGNHVGQGAFYGCTRLPAVHFTSGVSIGAYAFYNCTALQKLHFEEGNSATISDYAFYGCYSLDTLVIPNSSYSSIGSYAFKGCTGLQSVSLGDNVQSVGTEAFYGCYSLNELSLYSRCSLEDKAFAECTWLSHIYNYNDIPNTCNSSAFDGLDKFSCTLHVPEGTTDKYRIASVWRDFYYMEEMVPTYTVSVQTESAEQGSVTGGGEYLSGTEITLQAIPATGYRFVQWNDGNTDNPRTLTVTEDATYIATFAVLQLAVSAVPSDYSYGAVTGSGTYAYGETAVLEAIPNTGYWFYGWQDGSTDNPRTVVVTADATYTATFRPYTFTLSATSADASQGEVYGSGIYDYGETAVLEAVANTGYEFYCWQDGSTDNPRAVVVTADAEYIATFSLRTFTVSATAADAAHGEVSGSGVYTYGETAVLEAIANMGYQFSCWQDGNTDNPRAVVVVEDAEYTATFSLRTFTVSAAAADASQGEVYGSGVYTYGETAVLEAIANTGYEFSCWQDGNTDNPRAVVVVEDADYIAEFAVIEEGILSIYGEDVRVYATTNALHVEGLPTGVTYSIYTATGELVYRGNAEQQFLPASGLYIVQFSNGKVYKITVP